MSVKEKWASAFAPLKFTCGTHNLNRTLKITKLINSRLYGRCKMIDLYKLIEDLDQGKGGLVHQTWTQADGSLVLHHPLLRELRLHCTTFAFNQMIYEYAESHYMRLSSAKCSSESSRSCISVLDTRSSHLYSIKLTLKPSLVLASRVAGCSCEFYQSFGLICAHIFALLNLF